MELSQEQIAEQAMSLSASARADLADRLLASLDVTPLDDVARRWATEARHRLDDVRAGIDHAVPAEDVLAEARRRVGRAPAER